MLVFEIELDDGARRQQLLAHLELAKPDLEMLLSDTAITFIDEVDLDETIAEAGQLILGGLGYLATPDGSGILTFGTKIPAGLIDDGQIPVLLLLMQLLTQAADRLERKLHATSALTDSERAFNRFKGDRRGRRRSHPPTA